jgi:hypothetical protein
MNFTGFVPVRRGILEHTMSGELSVNEFAVLMVLILLADKSTGKAKINAPVLRTYLPGLSADAAKRALNSIDEKGYIFRQITDRSPLVYPFWVNGYQPSTGKHKMLQVSIAEARVSKDVRRIKYMPIAPDGAPDNAPEGAPASSLAGAPEGAPEAAHYNYKEKEKKTKKEKNTNTPLPAPPDQEEEAFSHSPCLRTEQTKALNGVNRDVPDDGTSLPLSSTSTPVAPPPPPPTFGNGPEDRLAALYYKSLGEQPKHRQAAGGRWPIRFSEVLASCNYTEADLTVAIEYGFASAFWSPKLDRYKGDPVDYFVEHLGKLVSQSRQRRSSTLRDSSGPQQPGRDDRKADLWKKIMNAERWIDDPIEGPGVRKDIEEWKSQLERL